MDLQVLQSSDSEIRVVIGGIHRSYASALRRLAMSEVPTMAIDDVVIIENSSAIYDELIGHRLGLVPLRTDLEKYILPEECDCKSSLGCSKCRVLLVMDVECNQGVKVAYSGDMMSEDESVIPTSGKIPIVKLAPSQKIKLEAYAKLGRGKDHAKWQATSAAVMKPLGKGEDEFELYLESTGSLPAPVILAEAIEILRDRLKDVSRYEEVQEAVAKA